MKVPEPHGAIGVCFEQHNEVSILVVDGVLDSVTYRGLRDSVIKVALEEPRAVVVDVNRLSVPSDSAWSVFASARWHVSTWPDVPIALVCARAEVRQVIAACGVARYVPVHAALGSAIVAVTDRSPPQRRRARTELPGNSVSIRLARGLITDWLTVWDKSELIPTAGIVATVFVENVLEHTESAPVLIVESYGNTVTVAVEDNNHRPASRLEDDRHSREVLSGLAIVSALCRAWGSTPTSSGKTVWASVGPENRV